MKLFIEKALTDIIVVVYAVTWLVSWWLDRQHLKRQERAFREDRQRRLFEVRLAEVGDDWRKLDWKQWLPRPPELPRPQGSKPEPVLIRSAYVDGRVWKGMAATLIIVAACISVYGPVPFSLGDFRRLRHKS